MNIVKVCNGVRLELNANRHGVVIMTESTGQGMANQMHQVAFGKDEAADISRGILKALGETQELPTPATKQCPRCMGLGELIAPWGRQTCPNCGLTGVVDA